MSARTAKWQICLATLAFGPDPSIVPHLYQLLSTMKTQLQGWILIICQRLPEPNGQRCKPRAHFHRLLTVIMGLKLMVCQHLRGWNGLLASSRPFMPFWDPPPIPGSYMRMDRAWWIPFKVSLTWYIQTQDTMLSSAIEYSRWYVTSYGPRRLPN